MAASRRSRQTVAMDVSIRALTKRWSGTVVFEKLDLEVASGSFVALVGRSGAGKSTLLHLIAGIDRPDAGSIRVGSAQLDAMDDAGLTALRRERMGLVFQNFNLLPSLSALDNVRLPLELVGVRTAAARLQAGALLAELGLGALADRFPEQLSGGEQQRVAVARALAHRPGLVLADEPTGSLDLESAAVVLNLLVEACRTRGVTLVMASHSSEVMGRAQRVLRLDAGRLVED